MNILSSVMLAAKSSSSAASAAAGIGVAAAAIIVAILIGLAVLIGIGWYVFQSLMLYNLAKRQGVNNPWLAWIPIANAYTLGEVAGSPMNLLGKINIPQTNLFTLIVALIASFGIQILNGLALIPFIGFIFGILNFLVAIAAVIAMLLVYYRIYSRYFDKQTTGLYAILSVLGVTIPFFLMMASKREQISEPYDFIL